jgi:molybdopterin-guanine dinucleotide biosynthesis protein A
MTLAAPNKTTMPHPLNLSTITLAILAGGESRRMGSSKAGMQIDGRPVLQYLLQSIRWPGPTLLVTAPSLPHPLGCDSFDRRVSDPVEHQGPLRGLLTALEHSLTSVTVILPVDMPAVRLQHLQWMIDRLAARPALVGLMLRRSVDGRELIEPFPLACRAAAAQVVRDQLQTGVHSLRALVEALGFASETPPADWPAQVWTNLNFPQDLKNFDPRMNTNGHE